MLRGDGGAASLHNEAILLHAVLVSAFCLVPHVGDNRRKRVAVRLLQVAEILLLDGKRVVSIGLVEGV
jgi:hypothetical protein